MEAWSTRQESGPSASLGINEWPLGFARGKRVTHRDRRSGLNVGRSERLNVECETTPTPGVFVRVESKGVASAVFVRTDSKELMEQARFTAEGAEKWVEKKEFVKGKRVRKALKVLGLDRRRCAKECVIA